MRGGDARVVDLVTIDSDGHALDLLCVRTEGGNKAAIGDLAAT